MNRTMVAAVLLACSFIVPSQARAADRVVATFKPVHSLVSAVMAGVGQPYLLMRGSESPHTYRMRPSDAGVIGKARVIFMIGERTETTLVGPIRKLGRKVRVVELAEAPALVRRPPRTGGAFEDDGHGHSHGHGHGHGRSRGLGKDDAFDMHVWLDPINAGWMTLAIARALSETDPANAAKYDANADALITRLEAFRAELDAELAPVRRKPFIVFHDAYQYFEKRFGLTAVGSAMVTAGRAPGVRRVRELRRKVRELGLVCVLAEPRYDPRFVKLITEGTAARAGTIDPTGITIKPGPEMYFSLLRNMAASFKACLAPSG
ncbi:MAG: zinc ABC transporter substrate-binding protein [Deltaproteobacteria bacterium]|nr:zinc ABC transporter substrate-binding protein [Deltaproteobacteria bacterium]